MSLGFYSCKQHGHIMSKMNEHCAICQRSMVDIVEKGEKVFRWVKKALPTLNESGIVPNIASHEAIKKSQ